MISTDEDISREFITFPTDGVITSPRKVELFIDLAVNGYRYDKMFKGKVTWIAEKNYMEHQFNVQVINCL